MDLGLACECLMDLRRDYPVSVHGVGLSLGSADQVDVRHLGRLSEVIERIEPILVSEHLAWTTIDGTYLNDLLPLPYTEESLAIVAANIGRVQDRLGRRLLIENPSRYLRYNFSTIPEAEFLAAIVKRTGCAILCDVNNIHVSAHNVGDNPMAYLAGLPTDAVEEIHLAGHSINHVDGVDIHIDDHGSRVGAPVWALYEEAVQLFPQAPALIEWDSEIPPLAVLVGEAFKANRRRARALWERKHVAAA